MTLQQPHDPGEGDLIQIRGSVQYCSCLWLPHQPRFLLPSKPSLVMIRVHLTVGCLPSFHSNQTLANDHEAAIFGAHRLSYEILGLSFLTPSASVQFFPSSTACNTMAPVLREFRFPKEAAIDIKKSALERVRVYACVQVQMQGGVR